MYQDLILKYIVCFDQSISKIDGSCRGTDAWKLRCTPGIYWCLCTAVTVLYCPTSLCGSIGFAICCSPIFMIVKGRSQSMSINEIWNWVKGFHWITSAQLSNDQMWFEGPCFRSFGHSYFIVICIVKVDIRSMMATYFRSVHPLYINNIRAWCSLCDAPGLPGSSASLRLQPERLPSSP